MTESAGYQKRKMEKMESLMQRERDKIETERRTEEDDGDQQEDKRRQTKNPYAGEPV